MHHAIDDKDENIDLSLFFVAKVLDKVVGVAGYSIINSIKGRTRLLAILPEFQGSGIGKALQDTRLEAMYNSGIKIVESRSDRIETILWYKKNYGYQEVGTIKKEKVTGLVHIFNSTILELDLVNYMNNKQQLHQTKIEYINNNNPHPLSEYPPLIINVALTGMIPTKNSTPYVPILVDEIIKDAIKVCDAGASIVHLHARDKDGIPVSNARYYEEIITAIKKERPHLICCVTTSGRNTQCFEERSEVLQLTGLAKPEMASLTLGSLNFLQGPSINSLEDIQRLAMLMKEKNIKPELEVFDSGMINIAKYLERHNIINGIKYFNIILGNINTASATLNDLAHLYSSLPKDSIWAAGGLGNFQLPMNIAAIIAGGNIRVGLEDNIYYDNNKTLTTNEQLVKRVVRISNEIQREISTPNLTRKILGINH